MTLHAHSIFDELEATLSKSPRSQRFTILHQMTDLFLIGAKTYSEEQRAIFDAIISRLIVNIERQALIELSAKLAPIERAPVNVIGHLSRDDDIKVSGPILECSSVLTDDDLVEIARTKSQDHLSAIAHRARLAEPVTDVLIDRGSSDVARAVTANKGARFSQFGFAKAVERAEQDETLALAVANRVDLPPALFEALVRKATTTVRTRLTANATPELRKRIAEVLSSVSDQVVRASRPGGSAGGGKTTMFRDPARLKANLARYVETRNVPELIDAVAVLCEVPARAVADLVRHRSAEGMIVIGKAGGMAWPELQDVLSVTMPSRMGTPDDRKVLAAKFVELSGENARRAFRFIKTSTAKSAGELLKLI